MRVLLLFAAVLIGVGLTLSLVIMSINGWDFEKVFSSDTTTEIMEINGEFASISIEGSTQNVRVLPSDDGSCKVVFELKEGFTTYTDVTDGVLTVKSCDERKWYKKLFGDGGQRVTIYLPEEEYASLSIDITTGDVEIAELGFKNVNIHLTTGDVTCRASATESLKIKGTTGDVELSNVSAGSVNVDITTGDIDLSNIKCTGVVQIERTTGELSVKGLTGTSFNSKSTTGDNDLSDVIVTSELKIKGTTGKVNFRRCDAGSVWIDVTTGDVDGSFLSDKIIFTETSTGDVDVPRSTVGGRCDIETTTGDITISIEK